MWGPARKPLQLELEKRWRALDKKRGSEVGHGQNLVKFLSLSSLRALNSLCMIAGHWTVLNREWRLIYAQADAAALGRGDRRRVIVEQRCCWLGFCHNSDKS